MDQQTLTERILEKLRDSFGTDFQEYYDGDPIDIPRSALPCIIVSPEKTVVTSGATGQDKLIHTVSVVVALDKQDDYGRSSSQAVTTKSLQAYAMAQTEDKTFQPNSVMGILRTDLTLQGYLVQQEVEISYEGAVRPETITAEARLTFTCTETVPVTRYQGSN